MIVATEKKEMRYLVGICILLAVVFCANSPYFEKLKNVNELPRLLQGIAIVEDGDWSVEAPSVAHLPAGIDLARGADGRMAPNKPPGSSLVASGVWLLLRGGDPHYRRYLLSARLIGGALPLLWLAWFLLRRRFRDTQRGAQEEEEESVSRCSSSRWVGVTSVALLLFATPLWSQAHLFFGHALAAAFLYIGTTWVLDDRSLVRSLMGGMTAGLAVFVEYTAAFAGLVLAVLLLVRIRRAWGSEALRDSVLKTLAALTGALLPMAALAGYHALVFGSPWKTGYHYAAHQAFAEIHSRGLLGLNFPTWHGIEELLFSAWGGLLYWAPLCVLAVLGLAMLAWRSRPSMSKQERMTRERARVHLAIFSVVLVVNLGLEQTGGWRVGPRYLMIGLPFLVLGWELVLEELCAQTRVFAALVAMTIWSVVVNALAANLFPHLIPEGNPLGDLLVPLLLHGRAPWGVLDPWAVLVLAVLCMCVLLWKSCRIAPEKAVIPLIVGVVGGFALVIVATMMPGAPLASINLHAIESVWEPLAEGEHPSRRLIRANPLNPS